MARGVAFDLERVEVLKGPQGTLFGQNSTGGAVNYIAAKPSESFAAGADLEVGRFDEVHASGFVSGPVSDKVGVRLALQDNYQGDWQNSRTRKDTRGAERFYNGRLTFDLHPSDAVRFLITASGWVDKSDTQAPQFVYFVPSNPASPRPEPVAALANLPPSPDDARSADWDPGSRKAKNDSFYQLTSRGDINLVWATLTSISSYAKTRIDSPAEFDGTAFNNSFVYQNARLETFSQEIRLAGDLDKHGHWLVGANYQYADSRESILQTFNATNSSIGPFTWDAASTIDNQRVNTYAGFGSIEYNISDTLTARASGRYTVERRKFNGCLADPGNGQLAAGFSFLGSALSGRPISIPPGGCTTFNDVTFEPELVHSALNEHNFSWRVGLDWRPASTSLLYVNIAKGYKSGGFSVLPEVFARQAQPVTQEAVLDYEAGAKLSLWDRRAQLNVAAFYYDYTDKQLQGYVDIPPFGPLATLINLPKARVAGAEFDLTARLTEHLDVKIGGTYLDTKAKSSPALPIAPLGGIFDFAGESFPNTPKYHLVADVEQRIPLGANLEGYVGAAVQYHGKASAAFGSSQNELTRSIFTIDAYTLLDLRAGLNFGEKVTFEIFGRNVTNKFYVHDVDRTVDTVIRYTGEPATYGMRFRWRY
jgi:outer membrane receptor protein involved in Fe transport